ncbi:MAG: DUF5104 domain-containing protein [Firmicutes bacterium]|nr:DUF5104 domain-containing protein [Bacillota bacterium]
MNRILKMAGILCILLVFTGCNNSITFKKQIDKNAATIVKAFDTKDKDLLKSVFHKKVLENESELDEQIERAFNIYKGSSISYSDYDDASVETENGKIHYTAYPQLKVTTDKDVYFIEFAFNIRDDETPQNEGIYVIKVLPKSIYDDYGKDGKKYDPNELIEEEPIEMQWGGGVDTYEYYGLGVLAYTREDIMEAYYKKNGKPMPLKGSLEEITT